MKKQTVIIQNSSGLQIESAGVFCNVAMRYQCKTRFFYRHGNEANVKSVLSILGAGIRKGEEIEICCEGVDEKEALAALVALVESGFDEGI